MKQKGLAPIYLLIGLVILGVIFLTPIPYYQGQVFCIPCPQTETCSPCPKPGWKLGDPLWNKIINYFYDVNRPVNSGDAITVTPLPSPSNLEQVSASPRPTESSFQTQYELTFEKARAYRPDPPEPIEAQRTTNGVLVTWPRMFSNLTKESDKLQEYRLYRRLNESSDWQLITTVKSLPEKGPYSKPSNSYLDPTKENFEYAVAVVSIYGVEGFKSKVAKPSP